MGGGYATTAEPEPRGDSESMMSAGQVSVGGASTVTFETQFAARSPTTTLSFSPNIPAAAALTWTDGAFAGPTITAPAVLFVSVQEMSAPLFVPASWARKVPVAPPHNSAGPLIPQKMESARTERSWLP